MPDFEISIRAAEDNEDEGIIGARGATGGEVTDADYAHVRAWLKGMLFNLEGAFPPGWSLEIVSNVDATTQQAFTGNVRKATTVELPADRLDQIETSVCASLLPDGTVCGQPIANQGDDVWYHLQPCPMAEPMEEVTDGTE